MSGRILSLTHQGGIAETLDVGRCPGSNPAAPYRDAFSLPLLVRPALELRVDLFRKVNFRCPIKVFSFKVHSRWLIILARRRPQPFQSMAWICGSKCSLRESQYGCLDLMTRPPRMRFRAGRIRSRNGAMTAMSLVLDQRSQKGDTS